jgi:hypothetical protein
MKTTSQAAIGMVVTVAVQQSGRNSTQHATTANAATALSSGNLMTVLTRSKDSAIPRATRMTVFVTPTITTLAAIGTVEIAAVKATEDFSTVKRIRSAVAVWTAHMFRKQHHHQSAPKRTTRMTVNVMITTTTRVVTMMVEIVVDPTKELHFVKSATA